MPADQVAGLTSRFPVEKMRPDDECKACRAGEPARFDLVFLVKRELLARKRFSATSAVRLREKSSQEED